MSCARVLLLEMKVNIVSGRESKFVGLFPDSIIISTSCICGLGHSLIEGEEGDRQKDNKQQDTTGMEAETSCRRGISIKKLECRIEAEAH